MRQKAIVPAWRPIDIPQFTKYSLKLPIAQIALQCIKVLFQGTLVENVITLAKFVGCFNNCRDIFPSGQMIHTI